MKSLIFLFLAIISVRAACQSNTDQNQTDGQGRKQGHWIKKDSTGKIQYEGTFRDNHPVGEFKRYYENNTLKSLMNFSNDGKEAYATIYHPNGYIASEGKYINQLKEGKWKFYSQFIKGYLINEEPYTKNVRNGLSVKYFPDSTIAEKINYLNGVKEGEWLQYHPGGSVYLKAFYTGGRLNGNFEVWYKDGKSQMTGTYKNDIREGKWKIFREDGTLRYELNYVKGNTDNTQIDRDFKIYLDSLELNKDKIADPEKTGIIR